MLTAKSEWCFQIVKLEMKAKMKKKTDGSKWS